MGAPPIHVSCIQYAQLDKTKSMSKLHSQLHIEPQLVGNMEVVRAASLLQSVAGLRLRHPIPNVYLIPSDAALAYI